MSDDNFCDECYGTYEGDVCLACKNPAFPEAIRDWDWEHIFQNYANAVPVKGDRKEKKRYDRGDVDEVLACVEGENDGAAWVGFFKMKDGKFMTIRASCDYTGWGCQEGGNSDVADTASDAWNFGLDQDERGRLIDQVRGKGIV